jgi:hypothetical protein
MVLLEWQQNDILRALHHTSMFPIDSLPANRVQGRNNDYYCILAILSDSHPALINHPITLCKNLPYIFFSIQFLSLNRNPITSIFNPASFHSIPFSAASRANVI